MSTVTSRRGLFGFFTGAIASSFVPKLGTLAPVVTVPEVVPTAAPSIMSEIIATSLRATDGAMAANITSNNALLARLKSRYSDSSSKSPPSTT